MVHPQTTYSMTESSHLEKVAREYTTDALMAGTTIFFDWSFPKGEYIGKNRFTKAAHQALQYAQKKSKVKFKVHACGEMESNGFHCHGSVVCKHGSDSEEVKRLVFWLDRAWERAISGGRKPTYDRAEKITNSGCNIVRTETDYVSQEVERDYMGFGDLEIITHRWKYMLEHELTLEGFPCVKAKNKSEYRKSYFEF